jgi:hypothetical protein
MFSGGDSFNTYPTLDGWTTNVDFPQDMQRSDSDFSQEHSLEDVTEEPSTGARADSEEPTATPGNVFFQFDDIAPAKRIGRKRKLTDGERRDAHLMRRLRACYACKLRKIKCDPGIPCKRCVIHWQDDLRNHPCRGDQLQIIADTMILENAFPRGNPDRFMPNGYTLGEKDTDIKFDLGFGTTPMTLRCRLVVLRSRSGFQDGDEPLIHTHMAYSWPPCADLSDRTTRLELVFPVKIAAGQNLEAIVESYLGELLEQQNFFYFPSYQSHLKVLLGIYWIYQQHKQHTQVSFSVLATQATNISSQFPKLPLEDVLKLLVLVHMGGELRVCRDPQSQAILSRYAGVAHLKVTPCLVRAQLGEVFSKIAHKLMTSVLKELEALSQVTDPQKFPVIVGTFSVLAMVLESLQYHVAKLPYHCHNDNPTTVSTHLHGLGEPSTRDLADPGADILLRFYKATACYQKLGELGTGAKSDLKFSLSSLFAPRGGQSSHGARSGSVRRGKEPAAFLNGLHNAVAESRDYLAHKATLIVAPYHDLTAFFDRLLARMYIPDPPLA